MHKVIIINLNGRAYSLEEAGYEALRKYLDEAAARLEGNPDKDELMADFEQAIADKCEQSLHANKNVVSTEDIQGIIAKMGPVDAGAGSEHANKNTNDAGTHATASGAPKRLYQLRQGAWITGVCNGLAAYFNVDVALIRVLFVVATALTHGVGVLVYVVLAIVMPVARTDEEKAHAYGTKPFNAHDFIEQAKMRYEEFQKTHGYTPHPPHPADQHDKAAWKKWKEDMKAWKQQLKHDMRQEKFERRRRGEDGQYARQNSPAVSAGAGFFRFLMGVAITALTGLWIFALIMFIEHGTILGYLVVPGTAAAAHASYPLWIGIVFLTALYYVVLLPFKLLMNNARPHPWSHYSFFNDIVQSLFFVLAVYLAVYTGRELFPIVNQAYFLVAGYAHNALPFMRNSSALR